MATSGRKFVSAQLERPVDVTSFWAFVERASLLGCEFMLADPTAADLMQCLQRERALLGELGSEELLRSMDAFYSGMVEEGQRLSAIRADLPRELLIAIIRDTTITFDRWFIAARAGGAFWPTSADAARTFTNIVGRISQSH
jgi:hypothetical protein